MEQKNRILIAVYSHPEFYPPTLNAIRSLSSDFSDIAVLSRNVFDSDWDYPNNVKLYTSGPKMTMRQTEQQNIIGKIKSFLSFTYNLYHLCKQYRPTVVQMCDSIPLMSFFLIRWLLFRKITLWYHNHDVTDFNYIRKYSINWWSGFMEKKKFNTIDVFSLPSNDRKIYFPMEKFKGQYFYLPNYPSIHFYNQFYSSSKIIDDIKIVYQGQIGRGHGFEEIINILSQNICNKPLSLHLKGTITTEYKTFLIDLAASLGVAHKLFFYGVTSYREVPRLASTCHIGIGIHSKQDIMNKTLGTASNKIYEYAALGLPVLLYDNQQFRHYLEKFEWALFTDLTTDSLVSVLTKAVDNYTALSQQAHLDFNQQLNYEYYFEPIRNRLIMTSN